MSSFSRFPDLRSSRVFLMDGAMGTELQRAGMGAQECYEAWNLLRPQVVQDVHARYVAAGAQLLLTNTFQANPEALAKHGRAAQLEPIFEAALHLARQAAGAETLVLADIGPSVDHSVNAAASILAAAQGADAVLLETLAAPGDALGFVRASNTCPGPQLPMLVCFAFCRLGKGRTLQTFQGLDPETCARQTQDMGATALGVNCGRDIGMEDVIEIVQRYRSACDLPLFARPNAGTPREEHGRWVYPHTPEAMAARVPELFEAGLTMIGGCCGTTPEHIAAFARAVADWNRAP